MSRIPGVSRHARERMWEHYQVAVPKEDWLAAVASILDRTAVLAAVEMAHGHERWIVRLAGLNVPVVWARDGDPGAQIVTVLPPGGGSLNPHRRAQLQHSRKGYAWGREPYHRARVRLPMDRDA